MSLLIQIVILFILLLVYFSSTSASERVEWGKALVLAVALPLLTLVPNYLGILGWVIALVISLVLIAKATGQSIAGSILFLIVLGFVLYFLEQGIQRFI